MGAGVERVSFEIERAEVYDALQAEATAHGRSVSEEVAVLIESTYAAKISAKPRGDENWVAELIELARTIDLKDGIAPFIPPRTAEAYEPPKL